MRLTKKIILASSNQDKFDEFQQLLRAYPGVELAMADEYIRNAKNLHFAERHSTYLENAVAKARLVNLASHYPALADDSGLEVDALQGKPGVRSHRYATPKLGVTQDQANIEFLLSELKSAGSSLGRGARFVCTLALVIEGILIHATGTLDGTLIEKPRGTNGFGYDPIFVPQGFDKTLAEMTDAQKNEISHRARALEALMAQVKSHGIIFAKP